MQVMQSPFEVGVLSRLTSALLATKTASALMWKREEDLVDYEVLPTVSHGQVDGQTRRLAREQVSSHQPLRVGVSKAAQGAQKASSQHLDEGSSGRAAVKAAGQKLATSVTALAALGKLRPMVRASSFEAHEI
ncbi:hypothetical protein PVAG01_07061 [Phlyctema vagabunda]|uniref:Uncharacterized protein n=1 Tax=Phlyctema vagabunda TaxID=108571 RepID=A0ABR4PBB8_9HELO